MTETLNVTSERVDDIPLLLTHLQKMGLQPLLDQHFPTHGLWQGLSLGGVTAVWLTHILSQADHRLSHVQPWAQKRLHTLQSCIPQPIRPLDFSDDRLAAVLRALSADERWEAFEGDLNRQLLRVYDLHPKTVRVDTSSAKGYRAVTPEGLFQFGHSKDHRPDLPQVKVLLATLDPLGLPVATEVLAGQRADDPLYLPAIGRVRQSLGRGGLLYVGDCKMASLPTRAAVHRAGDFYLCPLPETQLPKAVLASYLAPVWSGQQSLTSIDREPEGGPKECIVEGYERVETLQEEVEGERICWSERRLVVRSLKQARVGEERLRARVVEAQAAVAALNQKGRGKKRFREEEELRQAAEGVVGRYGVQGLVQLEYQERLHQRRVRRYGSREARVVEEWDVWVSATVDQAAVEAAVRGLGWRVYATNELGEQLSLPQGILAYREEYLIERGFGRLKGQPLSLSPMYLERDDHATGLIRLLSIGLRVLTLLEWVVRRGLAREGGEVAGLYAGNPKRRTRKPTAERLLEAFRDITLTILQEPHRILGHLTPLSELQQRILSLLGFSIGIYTRLSVDSSKPP